MSVDNDEQKLQDESEIEQVNAEQLAEAGAEAIESSTQDGEEAEIEQISAADLAGTQPEEKKEADKERNKLYAENRIAKKRLKELEAQLENGVIPESHAYKPEELSEKPKLQDFVSEERLYSEFNGSEALALAAFNEAKEEYAEKAGSLSVGREQHNESVKAQVAAQLAAEEAFDESISQHRKVVKNIDESLQKAESLLGEKDFIAVRNVIGGDNAALVLAVIGDNAAEQKGFMEAAQESMRTQDPTAMIKHLALLEQRVVSNLPSAKTISTAASETPVDGGGNIGDGTEKILRDIDAGKGKYGGMSRFERAQEKRNVQRERRAAS